MYQHCSLPDCFVNTNPLTLKFPIWFKISQILRDYVRNFQMIRSCSQIPPPGYTEAAAHRKRLRTANSCVSSDMMDSEESQNVFILFFDYVCIWDHILMLVNTYRSPWRTYFRRSNSRHDGNLLGFTHGLELIHRRKVQGPLETIKSHQTALRCLSLKWNAIL